MQTYGAERNRKQNVVKVDQHPIVGCLYYGARRVLGASQRSLPTSLETSFFTQTSRFYIYQKTGGVGGGLM